MRIIILNLLILASLAVAQTPFEFAVVQDLIQGEPFVSVLRIQITRGVPETGRTQLELTTRAGMTLEGENSVYPDSLSAVNLEFSGLLEYSASIPLSTIDRVFSVIQDCLNRFPGMRITDLALDVVGVDDMSWIGIRCSISSIDSVLNGSLDQLDLWRSAELREFEVGTAGFPTLLRRPGIPDYYLNEDVPDPAPVLDVSDSVHPWKSLLLPGWGQIDSGRGFGWLNIAVEAGGIALLVSGEKETGIAVLGVNHIISFIDLL
ncbi:MAG: hypothetical protein K8R76_08895 [Candidatus Aegiribacteria sp.]|nr:hypothetical protein [Candidatus Aegiribacteria sp.]